MDPISSAVQIIPFLHCKPLGPTERAEYTVAVYGAVFRKPSQIPDLSSLKFPKKTRGVVNTVGKWVPYPCQVVQEAAHDQSLGPTEHSPPGPELPTRACRPPK
jgi:hypothetical protein